MRLATYLAVSNGYPKLRSWWHCVRYRTISNKLGWRRVTEVSTMQYTLVGILHSYGDAEPAIESKHAKRAISTSWILCTRRIRVGSRSPIPSHSNPTHAEAIKTTMTLASAL